MGELLHVIDIELKLLKRRGQHDWKFSMNSNQTKPFRWTSKVVNLVELIYALDTCKCINRGEVGIEDLADYIAKTFGIEIKNCFSNYLDINRSKENDRIYSLNELRYKLNERMDESDVKGGKYKKW